MKYLKKFNQHLNYSSYLTSSSYNQIANDTVSYCVQENEVHYNKWIDPYNGHDYVEIGGVKWATMNVGANSITDAGLYFQWGDTQGYTADQVGEDEGQKYFGWADYKYGNGKEYNVMESDMSKYNSTDNKIILDVEDDAVIANWGGQWRMPTSDEMQSLLDNTTDAWTTNYQDSGIAGRVFTDKADSSKVLFFPAVGSCYYGSVRSAGSSGSYWSSSLYTSNVRFGKLLTFVSGACEVSNYNRYDGYPVRGVAD